MAEKLNSDGLKISYWSENPGKFRLLLIIVSVVLTAFVGINVSKNAATVFSGTHYMMMPSDYYIQKPLIFARHSESGSTVMDTIGVGSFLLAVNGVVLDSMTIETASQIPKILADIKPDEEVTLQIFNLKKVSGIMDLDRKSRYIKLSDTLRLKKSECPENFVRKIKNGVFIGFVIKDGATSLAGIKSGDVLLSINDSLLKIVDYGKEEAMSVETLRFFRGLQSGVPIHYKIVRNGETLNIDVYLATFGLSLDLIILLVIGFSIFILGFLFGLARPEYAGARLTSFAMILLAFDIGTGFSYSPPSFDAFSWLRVLLSNCAALMFFPVLFHSLMYFPSVNSALTSKKKYTVILYSAGILALLAFSVMYIVDYNSIPSWLFTSVITLILIYYIVIRVKHRNSESSVYNRANSIIVYYWFFIFAIATLTLPIRIMFPKLLPSWFEYIVLASILLIPAVYLYVIWKYKVFDIDLKVRRNIQYVIAFSVWKAFIAVTIGAAIVFLSKVNLQFPNIKLTGMTVQYFNISLPVDENMLWNKLLFLVLSVAVTALLLKADKYFSSYLDKKFYRGKYDYLAAQTELALLLEKNITIENLAKVFAKKIAEYSRLKCAGVMFHADGDRVWKDKLFCFDTQKSENFEITQDDGFFKLVTKEAAFFKGVTSGIRGLHSNAGEIFDRHNIQSVIPIKSKNKITGVVFIGEKLSETAFNMADTDFITSLSISASAAIENALLYEELASQVRMKKELEIAHRIQIDSLPQTVPDIAGLEIAGRSIPALEVGGDFYDYLNGTPDKFTVVVGDVSGKGTSAALYMSKVQGIFQTLNEFYSSPKKMLEKANHLLYKHMDSKSYITAIGATFDTSGKGLRFARAGHLPMFHYSIITDEIRKIQPGGIGLGLSDDRVFKLSMEEIHINYSAGDIFLFVTDGITEAMGEGNEEYGEQRLTHILKNSLGMSAVDLCDEVIRSVSEFSGNMKQHDDITLVAVKAK